jgi:Tol biopolymer transport system component/predicted Ser/Thr protein kinase
MSIATGTKLGPYEILGAAGAGGMGEVYRARDTRLDRTVAIKVLSTHLADRPDLQKRFEREARTISKLTHPHICALYDVGQQEGVDFLVMEYMEGETLGHRLQRGPLAPEQTLKYGIEIAEALETAHRQGIVHRDLKPGNVMLTKAGAKLMDFGLAKLAEQPAPMAVALSEMSTQAPPERSLTEEGVIVGTFQYMAPEQLEGKEADARTDLFALGMVLYEMATGRPAFTGRTKASVIAAILSSEPPPISSLQPLTPPAFDRVVKTCLAKDPDERWQSAHDLASELKWIAEGGSQAGVPAPVAAKRRHRERWAWVAAGLLAGIALMLAIAWYQQVRAPAPPVWASLNVSGDLSEEGSFALSPDGSRMVYLAADPEGKLVLWVRSLDSPKAQPLEGTQGAEYPFWSPDGRAIGFFANAKLKRIEATGQGLQTLCDAPNGRGGTWNQDGVIVFNANGVGGLARVSAAGGAPVALTQAGPGISHRGPYFLPDNRHFLFILAYSKGLDGVYAGSLDSAETKEVLAGPSSNAVYASGYLLLVRDGKLLAQPFDARALRGTGDAVLLGEGVRWAADRRIADFSAAANDMLVFRPAAGNGQRLVWFNREGKELGVAVSDVGTPTSGVPAGTLSPDGERVAVSRARGNGSDIWIYSLKTGLGTRLTFSDSFNEGPVWSADGSKVVFTRNQLDHYELRLKPASGAGDEQVLLRTSSTDLLADSWSRDGRYLSYSDNILSPTGKMQVRALALQGDRTPLLAAQSEGNAVASAISPDGKWLAYTSDETGRFEVYATAFPGHAGKWQLSNGGVIGGTIWAGSGAETEVIFQDLQSRLVSVPVRIQGGSLAAGSPRVLLGGRSVASSRFLDVTRDGRRVLLGLPQENASTPLTFLLNWTATLKK